MIRPASIVSPSVAAELELAKVIEGLTAKVQAGEALDIEACAREHPRFADELRQLLPALGLLAGVSGPGGVADAGEPQALGDFRIVREVGRGGMGVVYEAEQLSLGRRVALKVLPFAAVMDPRQLTRFHNEARAAASLEHPHIVPVYGVGSERGVHFYAMKLIDGRTLVEFLNDRGPEADRAGTEAGATRPTARDSTAKDRPDHAYFKQVARIGEEAADALEYAHSMGVVHRDVKPANLLLDARGHLWVADFGLARTGQADLTMTGDLMGTLRYMSPEQALAQHGLVDHRTDVYSLGLTLYELLTYRPAVGGNDRQEILGKIAFEEPVGPRKVVPEVPVDLETVVLKAMGKSAQDRYATAGELAADLRRFLDGRPVQARRPGLLQHATRWAGRHRAVVGLGMAALVVAVVTLAVSTAWVAKAHREAVRHKEAADGRARDLRQRLYPADVGAAHRAWQMGNSAQARELLARHVPAEGKEEQRGFEWHYLWDQCRPVESRTLLTQGENVETVAFSPDGKLVAVGCVSAVYLLDVASGRELAAWRDDAVRFNRLSFSADGSKLVSSSLNGTVRIHDLRTRRREVVWPKEKGHSIGGEYLPDGSIVSLVSRGNGVFELWDVLAGRKRDFPPGWRSDHVSAGAISGDGKRLALGEDSGRVSVWGLDGGPESSLRPVHSAVVAGVVQELAFTPDGKRLAAVTAAGTVNLFALDTFSQAVPLTGHEANVSALAASPDGLTVASGGDDQTIRLWGVSSRMQQAVLRAGADVACLAFSPCGKWLASGEDDGAVRLYRVPDGRPAVRLRPRPGGVKSLRLSPDGQCLVTSTGIRRAPILQWDRETGRSRAAEAPGPRYIRGPFSYSPDSKTLAFVTPEGVSLWDTEPWRQRSLLPGGQCLAFSPDGRRVVTGGADGALLEWDATTGERRGKLGESPSAVTCLAWVGNGRALASGHADGRVWLWGRDAGRPGELAGRHRGKVGLLTFSPDGHTLVTAGLADAQILIWEVSRGEPRPSITVQSHKIADLGLSPDGKTLAVAGQGRVALFHVATGQLLFSLEKQWINGLSVNFAPDGQSLLTGLTDGGELIVWHAPRDGAD